MVFLITGRQNSGKSKYYEKMLESKENKLYYATLWETEETRYIIERHKKRRTEDWFYGESIGNVEHDKYEIIQMINLLDTPRYCMIDGLTNWCMFCSRKNFMYIEEANRLAWMIVDLVYIYNNVTWYFLDNMKTDYIYVPILMSVWDIIHNTLKHNIEKIKLIEWRCQNEYNLD